MSEKNKTSGHTSLITVAFSFFRVHLIKSGSVAIMLSCLTEVNWAVHWQRGKQQLWEWKTIVLSINQREKWCDTACREWRGWKNVFAIKGWWGQWSLITDQSFKMDQKVCGSRRRFWNVPINAQSISMWSNAVIMCPGCFRLDLFILIPVSKLTIDSMSEEPKQCQTIWHDTVLYSTLWRLITTVNSFMISWCCQKMMQPLKCLSGAGPWQNVQGLANC